MDTVEEAQRGGGGEQENVLYLFLAHVLAICAENKLSP